MCASKTDSAGLNARCLSTHRGWLAGPRTTTPSPHSPALDYAFLGTRVFRVFYSGFRSVSFARWIVGLILKCKEFECGHC